MGFVKVIDESLKQIPDFIDFVSGTDESLKRVMRCVSVSSIVFDEMLTSSLLPLTSVLNPYSSPYMSSGLFPTVLIMARLRRGAWLAAGAGGMRPGGDRAP